MSYLLIVILELGYFDNGLEIQYKKIVMVCVQAVSIT